MLASLVYKELRLNINPWSYWWFASVLFLIVPAMPYFIAMDYIVFFFMFLTQLDKANQDLVFAASLPVSRNQVVTTRMTTVILIEVMFMILVIPVALAHYWLYPTNNPAGMNPNLAFFGLMFMMYATFNLIYLTGTYKKPYRMAWPVVGGALISMAAGGLLTSLVVFVPSVAIINDRGMGNLGAQTIVFVAGLIVYAGLTFLARRKAVSNFSKVDL